MRAQHALCEGAGLRLCDSCHRRVDAHPAAARNPHQPRVAPTTSTRCVHWLAKPARGAITPTDRRN